MIVERGVRTGLKMTRVVLLDVEHGAGGGPEVKWGVKVKRASITAVALSELTFQEQQQCYCLLPCVADNPPSSGFILSSQLASYAIE